MRYIGIIRSGSRESEEIAVGTLGIERILPNADDIPYLSGYVQNTGLGTLLVQFYQANRETQFITLQPNDLIEVKNIPCQRLQLFAVGTITLCEYVFAEVIAENDTEDQAMLLYTEIKKSSHVITYGNKKKNKLEG